MTHQRHPQRNTQLPPVPSPLTRPSRPPRGLPILALLGMVLALAPAALAQKTSLPRIWITGVYAYPDHNGWYQGI